MLVTVNVAETNLLKLIEAAISGEEVVIAEGNTPMVKLVPIMRSPFKIGLLKGQIGDSSPDFLEAMTDDELALWDGRP